MPEPMPERIQAFTTAAAFGAWLAAHHEREPELWLKIYKKASGQATVNWEEAVIEALCWGWIDSIRKSLDSEAYLQRFTPRRKGSVWSQRNCEHVGRLIAAGSMQPAGLREVEAAQADGRWQRAYAPPSEMTLPADFLSAVEAFPRAAAFLDTLNKQNRYAIAYHLQTAKKPETRQRRMEKYINMLKNGEKLH